MVGEYLKEKRKPEQMDRPKNMYGETVRKISSVDPTFSPKVIRWGQPLFPGEASGVSMVGGAVREVSWGVDPLG